MKRLIVVLVCLVCSDAFGQQGWHAVSPAPPLVPVNPAPTQQVQVQVGPGSPPVPSPAPMPVTPPTYEGWRDGWRESWVHEFRPLRNEPAYHHRDRDGFYYNPSTGCHQRDVWPQTTTHCQPQYVYPQQYQYQYVYPQYQYQYRQPCSIWPW